MLFFSSRLMMLMAFPPENLIFYGDYRHYFNLADLTRQGFYPFIHYWYEFPPIFPYLNIAVYTLAGQQLKNYIPLLAFVLLLVECSNLYLLYRLAFILHGLVRAIQIAWIYTALFVPIFFWLGNFDALTAFFILLGLYSLAKSKSKILAVALGLGTMVKFIPAILLATVWRSKGLKSALVYGAVTILIGLIIFGPFALANPTMTIASLQAQVSKSSYETIWALVDGNYITGNFGPLIDHFDAAKATQPINNPARVPTWLTLIPFGLLGLFIFTRPQLPENSISGHISWIETRLFIFTRPQLPENPNFDTLVFTTLTFIIFFLWSQGWSPQWQTFLIPLLLLTFPVKRAVLFIIVLGFINFLEWPIILSRGMGHLLPVTIIARTLLFILVTVELYRILTRPTDSKSQRDKTL